MLIDNKILHEQKTQNNYSKSWSKAQLSLGISNANAFYKSVNYVWIAQSNTAQPTWRNHGCCWNLRFYYDKRRF